MAKNALAVRSCALRRRPRSLGTNGTMLAAHSSRGTREDMQDNLQNRRKTGLCTPCPATLFTLCTRAHTTRPALSAPAPTPVQSNECLFQRHAQSVYIRLLDATAHRPS